jgi:hypothetical protein
MKKRSLAVLGAVTLALFGATAGSGQSLFQIKAPDLSLVYYSKSHSYIVSHLARCYENAMGFYKKFFDYTPTNKVSIFLQDFSDYGNGGATAIPQNLIYLELSPFMHAYDMTPANERMSLIMNHELVHVVTMDKPVGSASFFRKIFFGKVNATAENPLSMFYAYLTSPRTYAPRWYVEGIAVFMETWMNGGLGRALGAYDEMVFRSKVLEGGTIYEPVGLESEGTAIDWQTGAISYMYGSRFFDYLADQYGPRKLIDWTVAQKNSRSFFANQFKLTFGSPLSKEWSKWIAFETAWQKANLEAIRKYPVTPFRSISTNQLGSISRAYLDAARKKIYAAINYPGQVAHLAAIDIATGRIDRICDIKGGMKYSVSSLAYDPSTGQVFFTADNGGWRDLCVADVMTGNSRILIPNVRAGDFAFNPKDKSLWGIRHYDGLSTIIKVPPPYTDWTAVYAFDYFNELYDIDLSPDGTSLSGALADVSGQQVLAKFSLDKLLKGDGAYETLYKFGTDSPANFAFSPDGRYIYGSSYYTGASNIFRYDLKKKQMDVLSNCETGFFRPVPVSENELIVFKYSGDGFVPGWIPNKPIQDVNAIRFLGQEVVTKYPEVKTWRAGSPASVNIDAQTTYSGPYNSWKDISLESAYPVVEGYKDSAALGFRMNFRNALRFNGFDMTASYSPNPDLPALERVHALVNYQLWSWKFTAGYNTADFYDLFGPTKTSRKGYSLSAAYGDNLIYDDPRFLAWDFKITGYWGMEKLPDYQNIDATYDKFLTAKVGLNYDFVRKSLGAVDEEKGMRFHLTARAELVNGHVYPRLYGMFDYGIALPLGHSSLWLRTSAGQSIGDRDNVFVNFYFGGFGNNWIDYQTEKRYREYYSFPGVDLQAFGGRNYAKALLEWSLPPLRFRRLGFLNLYCHWARLALFTSAIMTNFDTSDPVYQRKLVNFGAQVDFRVVLFTLFNTTLSFGYARAYEKGIDPKDEWMVSLKIL